MKNFIIFLFILSNYFLFTSQFSYPQSFCGTQSFSGEIDNPDNFRGGFYKPSTSNIGGAPSGLDFFPVLIVFIQFQNEPYSYSTDPNAWNSGYPPNYMDSLISFQRLSSSDWWNTYNGYAISDYWHEFSRGKLHVKGDTASIILSHPINWYDTTGRGLPLVLKETYDVLKNRLGSGWKQYDQWKLISDGVFAWQKDSLVDMIYTVFRQNRPFLFDGFSGYSG